jgi:putative ABC transport system permease protein
MPLLDSLRAAARSLKRQPAFVTVVVLSLALGIALNTTMYGMLDAMLRPRIDVRDPARLYWIRFYGDYKWQVDNPTRDATLAAGTHTYESVTRAELAVFAQQIQHDGRFSEGVVQGVAWNYFDVLGARPLAGRSFVQFDEASEAPAIVIDETLAAELFPDGAAPVGATITLNHEPRTVVGVVSDYTRLPGETAVAWQVARPKLRGGLYQRLIRLRPGATRADAERELQTVSARIAMAAGENPKDDVLRFHQAADPEFQLRPLHRGLVAAVAAILLVACANLANIQLARGIGRKRELALRSALGASRARIIAHLMGESILLGVAGLALGLVLTYWGARSLHASIPPSVGKYIVEPQLSWRVLVFAIVALLFCLFAVGLAPAISVSRTDPNDLLKSGAGTGATKPNRRRYAILVGVEIALSLALCCIATATVHTWMYYAARSSFGYDPRPLTTGSITPSLARGSVVRYSELLQSMSKRIAAIPGVSDAATSMSWGYPEGSAVTVADAGGAREYPAPLANITAVSPGYVRTMGWPIVQGRDFLDGERDHGGLIIDAPTARKLWPNANPIGALLKLGDRKSNLPYVPVVGMIGEQRGYEMSAEASQTGARLGRVLYLPGPTDTIVATGARVQMTLRARATDHPERLPTVLRQQIGAFDDVTVSQVMTMVDYLGVTTGLQGSRFLSQLFVAFAALAIALAAFGVYGVVAHSVAERRRELGVRVALGASSRDILHAVLRESVVIALAGTALGLFFTKQGVLLVAEIAMLDVYNAPMFAVVSVVVLCVAAGAAFVPAVRATRIDPTESLRAE